MTRGGSSPLVRTTSKIPWLAQGILLVLNREDLTESRQTAGGSLLQTENKSSRPHQVEVTDTKEFGFRTLFV